MGLLAASFDDSKAQSRVERVGIFDANLRAHWVFQKHTAGQRELGYSLQSCGPVWCFESTQWGAEKTIIQCDRVGLLAVSKAHIRAERVVIFDATVGAYPLLHLLI